MEGLISTRKGRTDVIRWDEVTAVQVGPSTSYTLRRADGKVLQFDDTLRQLVPDYELAKQALEQAT